MPNLVEDISTDFDQGCVGMVSLRCRGRNTTKRPMSTLLTLMLVMSTITPKEEDTFTEELKKRIKSLELNGEFLSIQIGEGLDKTVQIGADFPDDVKEELVKCLQQHSDPFTWSAADMPGISPDIGCHHLVVDPKTKWVTQCRRA